MARPKKDTQKHDNKDIFNINQTLRCLENCLSFEHIEVLQLVDLKPNAVSP